MVCRPRHLASGIVCAFPYSWYKAAGGGHRTFHNILVYMQLRTIFVVNFVDKLEYCL